jgi:hypothetical protein
MTGPLSPDDEELLAILANAPILDEDEDLADERAEADVAAGRVISNERVVAWLRSWGTDTPLPPPRWEDEPK